MVTCYRKIKKNNKERWFCLSACLSTCPPQGAIIGTFFSLSYIKRKTTLFNWQKLKPSKLAEKPPPPSFLPFGEILGLCRGTWHNFTPQYFMHHWTSHWWQLGRKAPPPRWGKIFWHWIYPFQAISSNFGFCGRKAPPPQDEGNFFAIGSIHFRQFPATLVFVAEKPPLPPHPRWGKIFWLDLSISGDFQQLWFLWQKSSPLFSAFSSGTGLMSHR